MNDSRKSGDLGSARILIVDDVPENIQVVANLLAKEAFQLSAAMSGRQALDMMERSLPDLVLLDVSMPEMDGYETCRSMKANPATAEIPVIFLTGRASQEDILHGFEAGGVDYVSKPFSHPELLARVHTHLHLRRLVELERKERQQLEESLAKIKQLSGLLPICARCKCIRDDQGYWNQLEKYLTSHAEVEFTHGICPNCAKVLYPEVFQGRGEP
jgi:CheY-like chemotaxis protein